MLAHLLGQRAVSVGDIEGISVIVPSDHLARRTALEALAAVPHRRGALDAEALWILRHGLVHFLGRDAAAYHARRLARDRARGLAREHLPALTSALRSVVEMRDALELLDADLPRDAARLLAVVERANQSVVPTGVEPRTRARYEKIWNAFTPKGPHDQQRLVFLAACRAAGLDRPYQASMVAALERGPQAVHFASGSRLLELGWRRSALEYWRKAGRDLDRAGERRR